MGITLWRQRAHRAPTQPLVSEAVPKFVIVAESDKADKILLNNILKALNCSSEEAMLVWTDQPEDLSTLTWPQAPVIVFGETLHTHVPKGAIKTLSLTALNQDLAAKKALWAQLKALL